MIRAETAQAAEKNVKFSRHCTFEFSTFANRVSTVVCARGYGRRQGMTEWANAAKIGLKGLTVHKFRAALSMLGIIFGVASVVAVIAVSEGARGEVLKQLAALGANNIMVNGI